MKRKNLRAGFILYQDEKDLHGRIILVGEMDLFKTSYLKRVAAAMGKSNPDCFVGMAAYTLESLRGLMRIAA